VFDAAVEQAYAEAAVACSRFSLARSLQYLQGVAAGRYRGRDPRFCVAIKGPLTTPVGGGIRSLNVALRQILDLYSASGRSVILQACLLRCASRKK